MESSTRSPTLMPHVRLGVHGLPNVVNGMRPGGLYVLVAETAATRLPLFASTLSMAINDGRRCSVVVPGNPEPFIKRLAAFGNWAFQRSVNSGQCQIFVAQEEMPKAMFRLGAKRFVQELEHFDVAQDSYLLLDQADDLISLHDVSLALEQVDILARWLADRRVTALLAFQRVTEAQAATLNALTDSFAGIARLASIDGEGLRLHFDYWQSPEGSIAARPFVLDSLESGLYEVVQHAPALYDSSMNSANPSSVGALGTVASISPPPDDSPRHYFYMDPDLGSLAVVMPGTWQHVSTLVGMMHAIRNHRAPIVIFCYRPDTSMRQLAEAVHTLRVNLGPHGQLIVQEKEASLRYQNEALLLRLGLNLVILRDVATARIPLLLNSLSGQTFNRDVDIDFEAALDSVAPSPLRGYQPPTTFVREVRGQLDRSATLSIPFVLIVGLPMPGQTMVDVLSLIHVRRAGDLFTADTRHCYIFLHACQQATALSTLERFLGSPVDQIFEELRFQVLGTDVDQELEALLHNASTGMALDYTSQLPTFEPTPLSAPQAEVPIASPGTIQSSIPIPASNWTPVGSAQRLHDPRVSARETSVETQSATSGGSSAGAEAPYRPARPPSDAFGREAAPRAQRSSTARPPRD